MPRFGGGGNRRSSSRPSSPPPRSSQAASRPAPTQAPPMQTQSPSFGGGLGSTLMTGMAFGAGSEVAHQAVRGIMGGSSHSQQQPADYQQQAVLSQLIQPQQQQPQYTCMNEANLFTNCLKTNTDITYCQQFSDMLKQCQQSLHQ